MSIQVKDWVFFSFLLVFLLCIYVSVSKSNFLCFESIPLFSYPCSVPSDSLQEPFVIHHFCFLWVRLDYNVVELIDCGETKNERIGRLRLN